MTAIATHPAPGTPAAPITDPVDPAAPPTPPIEAPPAVAPDKPADPPAPPADPSKKAPDDVVYDLKLPAESTLDPAVIERTAAIARSLGLSNEAAQKALDLVHQEVTSAKDATLESFAPGGAEWTKQTESWAKETLADPALGNTPAERLSAIAKGQSVLAKYTEANAADAEAFKGFLNETGFGSHPVAARFFAWLGTSASEGQMVRPAAVTPSGKEKSLGEIFYPKGAGRTEDEIRANG